MTKKFVNEDWCESEKRQLSALARRGISARQIAAALGRRVRSVKKMAREMRLIVRKKAKAAAIEAPQSHSAD